MISTVENSETSGETTQSLQSAAQKIMDITKKIIAKKGWDSEASITPWGGNLAYLIYGTKNYPSGVTQLSQGIGRSSLILHFNKLTEFQWNVQTLDQEPLYDIHATDALVREYLSELGFSVEGVTLPGVQRSRRYDWLTLPHHSKHLAAEAFGVYIGEGMILEGFMLTPR